jgi:hypothetical protein
VVPLYAAMRDHDTVPANVAQRSPILGYNHNVGYRGLVFHVQTEDSGIDNPHVFTHLFQGGVILTTRKLEYDVSASEDVVKLLMQSQHKAILKGLKHGEFDDKIDSYLGTNPDLLPRGEEPPPPRKSDVVAGEAAPAQPKATPAAAEPAAAEPALPTRAGTDGGRPRRYDRSGTAGRTLVQKAPPPVADSRSRPGSPADRPSSVLVSGPPIVVDSRGPRKDPAAAPTRTPPRVRESTHDSIFDQNLITEKSLDEVILAYLSEDADDESA